MTPPVKSRTRRVFVFGAGVSASCGIPVAKDILREVVLRLQGRDRQKVRQIHRLLHYLYPNFDKYIRNYPNIEDFLNLIEMAKTFNSEDFIESSIWSKTKLDDTKDILLKALTDYLWSQMSDPSKLSTLREFARKHIRPSDTVITFNWDVTLERSLWDRSDNFDIPYTYSRRKTKYIRILKPHGSIDWFAADEVPKRLHREMIALGRNSGAYVYAHFDFAKNPELGKYQPLIVPPIASKEFGAPFLRRTWISLYYAVAEATELNIYGYSLPKEDQFARLVLRRAIRNNMIRAERGNKRKLEVNIVNPDEGCRMVFSALVGQDVQNFRFAPTSFEQFVAGLEEKENDEFE